ncbi:MAG: DNA-binding protein [Chloroflexi bacterium]|nr:DNA-binding protein [Chloroflexota bacterium]
MPDTIAGELGEVILARFEPNEDLYLGLKAVAEKHKIRTGVILTITGGITVANLGYFSRSGPVEETKMDYHELTGPFEASGHGMIGLKEDGEPYLHVHLTVTCGDTTVCGHLHEGCIVRSLIPTSHFTVFIAKITGAELLTRWDAECRNQFPKVYPNGAPYHEIKAVPVK